MTIRGAHIAVEKLSHVYSRGREQALQDIDLQVEPGECLALIGRSGCGKSTLLHMMAGLLKPSTGCVLIDGARVKAPSPEWVMMFQSPCLYPWMTVAQNVGLGLKFTGRKREIPERVAQMLELVQMQSLAKRNVQDLSGGQQQRVALARSLATSPRVLLLDEPFSALDAFTRHALQRDIRRITRSLEITTVIVTHDISEATRMANRALVMQAAPGRIATECRIEEPTTDADADDQQASAINALTRAYEQATGVSLSDQSGLVHADHSVQSIRPPNNPNSVTVKSAAA
ncbi:MAG: ABC transporter ATP-binding protein [Burkholderiaceae bacterium]